MKKGKGSSLISVLFVTLISLSPRLKRSLWKKWYNLLASRDGQKLLVSMNYGYVDDELMVSPTSNIQPQLRLYEHVIESVPIAGRKVVEIGSGRGAGAAYIAEKHKPEMYVGVDLACNASMNSESHSDSKSLFFVSGDALSIPLKPGSVDVVVNIESSHCYADLELFIQQVSLSLVDDGYFCYCDLMPFARVDELKQYLIKNGLVIEECNNITANVMRALDHDSQGHEDDIIKHVPWYLRKAFSDFAGVKDTGVYNLFRSGKFVYYSFLAKKS